MATWKRFFTTQPTSNLQGSEQSSTNTLNNSNYASFLPEVYSGQPNRQYRYVQFDMMDLDPVINASLNIIAEFCSQENEHTKLPFNISFTAETTESEQDAVYESFKNWCYLNDLKTKMFHIIRKTLVYGDCFFIRDPETFEWLYVDPKNIEHTVVDENLGKKLFSYFIKDLDFNIVAKTLTTQQSNAQINAPTASGYNLTKTPNLGYSVSSGSRFNKTMTTNEIDAKHVIHLSLNTGLEPFWPFGTSVLEPAFKVFKQKELIEDSMVIYRIQSAPTRRIFYIDVGTQPAHKAAAIVDRIKNEIQQRRIPNKTGGGTSIIDTGYSPISILDDFFIPVNSEGKGTKIDTLPGGADIGAINDVLYFNNQLIRSLGVPSSYLPTGSEDSSAAYNDGKLGAAYVQELRFSNFCKRIQNMLIKKFDYEFKLFLKKSGVIVNANDFNLEFIEPESFGEYRTIEKDSAHFNILSQAIGDPSRYLSIRFALKRFGGLTDQEILENEKLWREEKQSKLKGKTPSIPSEQAGLQNIGITSNNNDSFEDFSIDDSGATEDNPFTNGQQSDAEPQQPEQNNQSLNNDTKASLDNLTS